MAEARAKFREDQAFSSSSSSSSSSSALAPEPPPLFPLFGISLMTDYLDGLDQNDEDHDDHIDIELDRPNTGPTTVSKKSAHVEDGVFIGTKATSDQFSVRITDEATGIRTGSSLSEQASTTTSKAGVMDTGMDVSDDGTASMPSDCEGGSSSDNDSDVGSGIIVNCCAQALRTCDTTTNIVSESSSLQPEMHKHSGIDECSDCLSKGEIKGEITTTSAWDCATCGELGIDADQQACVLCGTTR
jgi:hypothetical protein